MVTGGLGSSYIPRRSVELLNSDGSWYCNLPSLQNERYVQSQIGNLVCGGGSASTAKTCEVFNSGNN